MAKNKPKFYVVWRGKQTGIFTDWKDCEQQVKGFFGAQYKSFNTMAEAEMAIQTAYWDYIKSNTKPVLPLPPSHIGWPVKDSIAVDAAWNTASGKVEYQGVYLMTNEKIFTKGPYDNGTNNIGEFLALVHGLAYLQQHGSKIPIYTDSKTALSWLKRKHANTKLDVTPSNKELFELLQRAERWLSENKFENKVLKWETEYWGENPADFGRK